MKKSNRIIIVLVAVCALVITGVIIASRFVITSDRWLTRSVNHGTAVFASSEMITKEIDIEDFVGLVTAGSWEVAIQHAPEYRVKVTAPKNIHEYLDIGVEGKELHFGMKPGTRFRGSYKPVVLITMPFLEGIASSGQLELTFDGFNGELLSLHSSGVVTAKGKNSTFSLLKIEADGVANLELEGAYAESAHIDMGGVGRAMLNLGTGELTGSLGGVYQMTYKGTPSLVDVDTGGLSKVSQISE